MSAGRNDNFGSAKIFFSEVLGGFSTLVGGYLIAIDGFYIAVGIVYSTNPIYSTQFGGVLLSLSYSLPILIAGLIALPSVNLMLNERFGWKIPSWFRALVFVAGWLIALIVTGTYNYH